MDGLDDLDFTNDGEDLDMADLDDLGEADANQGGGQLAGNPGVPEPSPDLQWFTTRPSTALMQLIRSRLMHITALRLRVAHVARLVPGAPGYDPASPETLESAMAALTAAQGSLADLRTEALGRGLEEAEWARVELRLMTSLQAHLSATTVTSGAQPGPPEATPLERGQLTQVRDKAHTDSLKDSEAGKGFPIPKKGTSPASTRSTLGGRLPTGPVRGNGRGSRDPVLDHEEAASSAEDSTSSGEPTSFRSRGLSKVLDSYLPLAMQRWRLGFTSMTEEARSVALSVIGARPMVEFKGDLTDTCTVVEWIRRVAGHLFGSVAMTDALAVTLVEGAFPEGSPALGHYVGFLQQHPSGSFDDLMVSMVNEFMSPQTLNRYQDELDGLKQGDSTSVEEFCSRFLALWSRTNPTGSEDAKLATFVHKLNTRTYNNYRAASDKWRALGKKVVDFRSVLSELEGRERQARQRQVASKAYQVAAEAAEVQPVLLATANPVGGPGGQGQGQLPSSDLLPGGSTLGGAGTDQSTHMQKLVESMVAFIDKKAPPAQRGRPASFKARNFKKGSGFGYKGKRPREDREERHEKDPYPTRGRATSPPARARRNFREGCRACGGDHSEDEPCRAEGERCRGCRKIGHFEGSPLCPERD